MTIKSMPIEQLEEEAEKDMELRIDRTDVDAANTPSIYNKYHRQHRLVQTEIHELEGVLKRVRLKKWLYYSGKADPKVYKDKPLNLKIMKPEVNKFIDADKEVVELTTHIKHLELKSNFIEDKLKVIANRSYLINNIIKTLEFKHGIS